MKTFHSLTLFLVLAAPAFGVDGVVLINQSTALAGNVTPGDAPGFPVTISVPGSYRLSGNLVVPDANTDGIDISASNVTIDLNGFSIIGPTVCSGQPVTSCSPTGRGSGIAGAGVGLSISNGAITGMGGFGVLITSGKGTPSEVQVDKVRVFSNGSLGIFIPDGGSEASIVSSSVAYQNNGSGISTVGTVIGSTAEFNARDGIDGGGVIVNNSAIGNGGNGITGGTSRASLVSGNSAVGNGNVGIFASCPSNIVGNSATNNSGGNIVTGGALCTLFNNNAQNP